MTQIYHLIQTKYWNFCLENKKILLSAAKTIWLLVAKYIISFSGVQNSLEFLKALTTFDHFHL